MRGLKAWATAGLAVAVMVGAAGGTAAEVQAPPAGFTWYVLRDLNDVYFDIGDPTNRPPLITEVPEGVLVPVDVSKDGVTDWLIQWPEGGGFCGTGGCRRSLYVSDDAGYVRAFDRQAWDLEIKPVGTEVRLEASFHHLNCSPQREVCRLAWGWDPVHRLMTERPSADGEHILTSLGGPPVDLGEKNGEPVLPDDAPAALLALVREGARVCPVADPADVATTAWPALRSVPDLNGDDERDWVIDAPVACGPEELAAYGYQVWVSVPGGAAGEVDGVSLAWSGPVDHWPRLDVAHSPARLIDAPLCDDDETCPGSLLTWDAAAGAFRR